MGAELSQLGHPPLPVLTELFAVAQFGATCLDDAVEDAEDDAAAAAAWAARGVPAPDEATAEAASAAAEARGEQRVQLFLVDDGGVTPRARVVDALVAVVGLDPGKAARVARELRESRAGRAGDARVAPAFRDGRRDARARAGRARLATAESRAAAALGPVPRVVPRGRRDRQPRIGGRRAAVCAAPPRPRA